MDDKFITVGQWFFSFWRKSPQWARAPSFTRPLPDNTQLSQQTNDHAPSGIRTHNLNRQAAADLCLRPHGHWNRQDSDLRYQKSPRFSGGYLCRGKRKKNYGYSWDTENNIRTKCGIDEGFCVCVCFIDWQKAFDRVKWTNVKQLL